VSHDDYRVLAARIRAELQDIERVVDRAERARLLMLDHPAEDIYAFHLDPQRVMQLVEQMRPLFERVRLQLHQFAQMLEQWSQEAQRE
jgi:aryl carrier-like protein